jgi:hypothetical protein
VVSTPLKNISQWEGLSHILWNIKLGIDWFFLSRKCGLLRKNHENDGNIWESSFQKFPMKGKFWEIWLSYPKKHLTKNEMLARVKSPILVFWGWNTKQYLQVES